MRWAGIRAVLFDLDETLVDRTAMLERFAAEWHARFRDRVAPVKTETVAAIIREADGSGYRPKSDMFRELSERFPGVPADRPIRTNWRPFGMSDTRHASAQCTEWRNCFGD